MTPQSDNPRYHGLDFLRAGMMLLGIVLHVSVSYIVRVEGAPPVPWPYADPDQTHAAFLLTGFIHLFRMPGFFLLAGFFAGLLIDKRGRRAFFGNRVMRILVPLLIGWVVLWPLTMLVESLGAKRGTITVTQGGVPIRFRLSELPQCALVTAADGSDITVQPRLWFAWYCANPGTATRELVRELPADAVIKPLGTE